MTTTRFPSLPELWALADAGDEGAREALADMEAVRPEDSPYDDDQGYEGPTCSICDGLGHGYPGGGPCPLEGGGRYGCDCGGQMAADGYGCLCGGS